MQALGSTKKKYAQLGQTSRSVVHSTLRFLTLRIDYNWQLALVSFKIRKKIEKFNHFLDYFKPTYISEKHQDFKVFSVDIADDQA